MDVVAGFVFVVVSVLLISLLPTISVVVGRDVSVFVGIIDIVVNTVVWHLQVPYSSVFKRSLLVVRL